jgi:DNA-binding CsgD family transcriptional regulator
MRKLTKLQYQVIFLYSKGLTFKEIDKALATASKGLYTQIRVKDTRAFKLTSRFIVDL